MESEYKNLIVGGCSFTADGIGGIPPTQYSNGGCSFINDSNFISATPVSWAGCLAKLLDVKSFVNVAAHSHGINLTVNAIIELLNKFNYSPDNTLIVFNITDPGRLDVSCDFDHHDKSKWVPWDQNLIPYSYIDRNNDFVKSCERNQGLDQVEISNVNILELFMCTLEQRKFDFYFLLMKNYLDHPTLGKVIQKHQSHLIDIDGHNNMYDYSVANKLLVADDFHPNLQAHKNISEIVYEKVTDRHAPFV